MANKFLNTITVSNGSVTGLGFSFIVAADVAAAGSSGQIQFNDAGAFGGAAAVVYSATVSHLTITAQSATVTPLAVKAAASQSANLIEAKNSSGNVVYAVQPNGVPYGYGGALAAVPNTVNTAFGFEALASATSSSSSNTAVGRRALKALTTGTSNLAFGRDSLLALTTGSLNTAIGVNSMSSATTAASNVAIGPNALSAITTGGSNVAIGPYALTSITSGTGGVAIGNGAMQYGDTGVNNVAIGTSAGVNVGEENLMFGTRSLSAGGTTPTYNIAFGVDSGKSLDGNNCICIGQFAGSGVGPGGEYATGANNIAIGQGSLGCYTGSENVAIGYGSNASMPTGSYNVTIGSQSNCADAVEYAVAIGYSADAPNSYAVAIGTDSSVNATYSVAIGYQSSCDVEDAIVLGRASAIGGIGTSSPAAKWHVNVTDASGIGLLVRGAESQSASLQEWQGSDSSVLASILPNGAFQPASLADADAANGTLYYSTDAGKLVFKDSGGTVNDLY